MHKALGSHLLVRLTLGVNCSYHSSHATEFKCEIAKLPHDFSGFSITCHKRVVPQAPVCGGVKSAMKQPAKSQDPSSMNGLIRSNNTPFNTFRSQTNEDPTVVVQQWTAKKRDTFGRFLLNTHQCQVCAEVLSVGKFKRKDNQYINNYSQCSPVCESAHPNC